MLWGMTALTFLRRIFTVGRVIGTCFSTESFEPMSSQRKMRMLLADEGAPSADRVS